MKKNNRDKAWRAMLFGVGLALLALVVVPLPGRWLLYSAQTGVVGDTIGGIAGPILNFTGMVIVYYSLKEQYKSNRFQFKQLHKENTQRRNEEFFSLTFKLVERFTDLVTRYEEVFKELPRLNYLVEHGHIVVSRGQEEHTEPASAELTRCRWILDDLREYFTIIANRLRQPVLNGEQKAVLANLIWLSYGRKLTGCRVAYQERYGKGFERNDGQPEERPELLRHVDDRIVEIWQLQQDAERAINIERIPEE